MRTPSILKIEMPRSYGDNGTVYNMLLAGILREVITKGSHPALDIYLQSRLILLER